MICFFSCLFFIIRNVRLGRVRESRRWQKYTHREEKVWFFSEISMPLSLVLPGTKSPLVYIIFQMPTQSSWSYLPLTRWTRTHLLSSILPTQLTRHFLHPVYFRKQVYILLCHLRNLRSISAQAPASRLLGKPKCILLSHPPNLYGI